MGDPHGFVQIRRRGAPKRPVVERVHDYREVEGDLPIAAVRDQASRCMDCGIPFCHQGCPLGNQIPDWNDLVYRDEWREASERLHATNNFPEITGRICPAPCEEACVLNVNDDPVTIEHIEKQIADRAWREGWVEPVHARRMTGKRVAVVGSGPAGLAAAQQLARAGHGVTVFEREDRIGGLVRYGIPDFKLDKHVIDARIAQLREEGVLFETGVNVGVNVTLEALRAKHHAVCLATGAQKPRDLRVPGRALTGIHFALPYLTQQNRVVAGDSIPREERIVAAGKRVVILGGGDTGADCLGTAHRQGAASVHHFHYKPAPPGARTADMPWPWWPMILRETSAHEEGGTREWSVVAKGFEGDGQGHVRRMRCVRVQWEPSDDGRLEMREVPDSDFTVDADLVLLAIGFEGPEQALGLATGGGRFAVDGHFGTTERGVFACGDATRGASLVVWAIWEGRQCAHAIDTYLMGESRLPLSPNPVPL